MYCNVAVVLLIIAVSIVVIEPCPNKCLCIGSVRGVELNCTGKGLTDIPNISSRSYIIDLTRNHLTHIKRFTFYNIPELNFLYINGNEIENIEEDAFVLLDKLRHLYIHDNSLTTIKKGIFKDLPDLYWLRLQNNKISVIEAYAFTNLPGLGILFLENNSISVISEHSFANLSSIHRLFLQNNKITAIKHRIFDGLTGIWHIDMRGNNVTFVKNNTLEHLKSLGLLYLELICNCQNMPFLLWIKSRSIYGITCSDRNNTRLSNLHVCHFKDCDSSPCPLDYCANGGVISTDGNRDITCSCVAEWTGPRCTEHPCFVNYGCRNGAECDNNGTCICKDGFTGTLCATYPTTELNNLQKESSTSGVTTETTAYAVILGPVCGIVGLSVIVVVVILFMKRTSILKKFNDIPKQKSSSMYENEIRLNNRVYHDLTLVRGDNDSPYDAIHYIHK